ncbi:MAG: hypothetical protein MZV49_25000 [Rhodopseudomonas palustris]|nr:hypothetical protein [Rhodopseudomonas palustris]
MTCGRHDAPGASRAGGLRPKRGARRSLRLGAASGLRAARSALSRASASLCGLGRPDRWHLPVWAVAAAETRINRRVWSRRARSRSAGGGDPGRARTGCRGCGLTTCGFWSARRAQSLVTLPEARIVVRPPAAALRRRTALRQHAACRVPGSRCGGCRTAGSTWLSAQLGGRLPVTSHAAELRAMRSDRLFALPVLADLRRIEAEGMTLTLDDRRAQGGSGRSGDGRLTLENGPDGAGAGTGPDAAWSARTGPRRRRC